MVVEEGDYDVDEFLFEVDDVFMCFFFEEGKYVIEVDLMFWFCY